MPGFEAGSFTLCINALPQSHMDYTRTFISHSQPSFIKFNNKNFKLLKLQALCKFFKIIYKYIQSYQGWIQLNFVFAPELVTHEKYFIVCFRYNLSNIYESEQQSLMSSRSLRNRALPCNVNGSDSNVGLDTFFSRLILRL